MIRLLGVEIRRNLFRRLTRVLLVLFLLTSAAGIVIAWINVESYSGAYGDALEDQAFESCVSRAQMGIDTGPPATFEIQPGVFIEGPTNPATATPLPREEAEARCAGLVDAWLSGEPEGELLYYTHDPRPNATDLWNPVRPSESILLTIQSLLLIGGLGAAASMVGAEWKAGTITTHLTWTTNRVVVFATKAAAAALVAFVVSYLLQVVFSLGVLALIAGKGGVLDPVDGDWVASLAGGMARVSLLVGLAAVLGASLAMIFRNTAGAIIVVFAYMAFAEPILRLWRPDWDRWMVGQNMAIVLTGQPLASVEWQRGPEAAGLLLAAYIAALAAGAALLFHRRDITGAS